jgi:hypothetical protein
MKFIPRNAKGFWNFYRDGITQSLIGSYRECPIQCKLRYYDGYTPRQYSKPIHFGNCVHHVLASCYASNVSMPLAGEILRLVREYEEIWEQEQGGDFTIQQQTIWDEVYVLAEAICLTYFEIYRKDFRHNWEFTEKDFKVAYQFPAYPPLGVEPVNTFLRGKIDGGFRDENTDKMWLIDHKTKAMINIDAIKSVLPYDTQCMMYMLAWFLQSGEYPAGIIYNIIRTPQSKQKQGEDKADFIDRFRKTVEKDPDHYFYRIRFQVTPEEINQWEKDWLVPNLQEIHAWFESGCTSKTLNPDALETKYGLTPYYNLITTGSSLGYYRRKHPFPELDAATNLGNEG